MPTHSVTSVRHVMCWTNRRPRICSLTWCFVCLLPSLLRFVLVAGCTEDVHTAKKDGAVQQDFAGTGGDDDEVVSHPRMEH